MGARSLFLFDPYAHEDEQPVLKRMDRSEEERLKLCGNHFAAAKARPVSEFTQERKATLEPYRFKSMRSFLGTDKKFLGSSKRTLGTGSCVASELGTVGKSEPQNRESEEQRYQREQWTKETAERSRHFFGPPRRQYVHEPSMAHRGAITSVSISHTPSRLLSCGIDGHVRTWDPGTGKLLQPEAFAKTEVKRQIKNGYLPAATKLEQLTSTWKPSFHVECSSSESPLQLAVLSSPEDVCLVPEKENLAVYCLRRGKLIVSLAAHTSAVTCAEALAPDRPEVLSAGEDGRLLCWHAGSGSTVICLDD